MKWIKIKIETVPESLGAAAEIFESAGLPSLEIEDSGEFLEALKQTKRNWDFIDDALYEEKSKACSVAAYVEDTEAGMAALDLIKSKAYGSFNVVFDIVDDENWAETWKKYFKPIPVGKNILICPAWEAVPKKYKSHTIFKIEPGMSFGTGMHETTRLCAAALEKHVKSGEFVLDLGCGSGILSIIAAMLGAKGAVAADIDENCVKTALENAKMNGVSPSCYSAYAGDLLSEKNLREKIAEKKYGLALANIVPEVITALLPFIRDVLETSGVAVLSGIIGRYLPDVESAAKSLGFDIIGITSENDWQCLEVKKT